MLKGLTNTFKNGCNNIEVTYSEYVKLDNQIIPIKAELSDDSYENGNFIGTFIFKQIIFETDATYEFRNKEFEYYKVVNGESIKIGTFISTDITINDTTEIVKVIGMDYGLKTQVEYTSSLDYSSGTITLKDVWDECCTLSGLESGIDDFTNSDFIVDNDQFTGTGSTIRDVFKGIAMSSGTFVKVMNDDKIYLVFNELTSEKKNIIVDGSISITDYYKYAELTQIDGNITQEGTPTPDNPVPVNVVSGRQDIVSYGKNLYNKDNVVENKRLDSSGNLYSDSSYITSDFIRVEPSTDYTYSRSAASSGGSSAICYYKNDKTFISRGFWGGGFSSRTITTPSETSYIRTCDLKNIDIQIEKGSQPTEYEPYISKTTEINLGKNLFNINDTYYRRSTNNTVSISGNDITIQNNQSGSTNGFVWWNIPINTSNNITISYGDMIETTANGNNNLSYIFSDTPITAYNASTIGSATVINKTNKVAQNITPTGQYLVLILKSRYGGADYSYTISDIQVEYGSTKTSYASYKTPIELCKIGDYKDFIRKGTGKNLFNKDSGFRNGYISNTGEFVSSNTTACFNQYISCQPNTTYTISFSKTIAQLGCPIYYNNNKEYLSRESTQYNKTSRTITTPANCYYMVIQFNLDNESAMTQELIDSVNCQVELGNSSSSYEPYGFKDKWYIEKQTGKVVLNGSEEEWTKSPSQTYTRYQLPISNAITIAIRSNIKSNYFRYAGSGHNEGIGFMHTAVLYLYPTQTIITTDDFKTWLGTHNTIVYYLLATPTTTEITDTELINQLNSLELLSGINNISVESGDLTGIMSITYYNNKLDTIEDYVELEDKRDTHPWTCLRLGMSNIEGENVDYIDQELVEQYGENWLILNDNPFAYNQEKRQQLIVAIFNQIKEFGYSSFVSKVAFKPYLTSGDIIQFRNRDKELVKSIILRYTHNGEEITLEAPSETSATVNYVYPLNAIDIAKQTQIVVDKDSVRIDSLTSQTQTIQDNLRQNYYTLEQTNELVQTAQTGLTNTFSEAGGNNIFRNTGLWFATNDSNNPYEFWNGVVVKQKEEKASNMSAMLLQNGNVSQEQLVPNGKYTISFKYNKPVLLATAKIYINDTEYVLNETTDTEFTEVIEVSSQHINIRFNCDVNNGCEIYDLMVNAGEVKLAYSQNQNETTTDTVNISKGITITSSDIDVKFKADADGIRTIDKNNNELTKFTDTGMTTKEAIIQSKSQIVGTLWQEVGGQTWITRL